MSGAGRDGKAAILANVRRSLGRAAGAPIPPRPPVRPSRPAGTAADEIARLLAEIAAVSGQVWRGPAADLDTPLAALVAAAPVRSAAVCQTPALAAWGVAERLARLGVTLLPPDADKFALAGCDLGVTEVDFALPETGTLGLYASAAQPRAVSLLPRLHLALIRPAALVPDLAQVFAAAKGAPYLVFITGPSRTADIEMTVALGVHGPEQLHAWVVTDG